MTGSRWTGSDPDAAVVAVCRDSAIVGFFGSATRRVASAYHGSRASRWIGDAIGAVRTDSGFNVGVVLITAAVVHAVLLIAGPGISGWRALVIPAIAAAQGAAVMLTANARRR